MTLVRKAIEARLSIKGNINYVNTLPCFRTGSQTAGVFFLCLKLAVSRVSTGKYLCFSKTSRAAICTERGATVAILAGVIHAGRRQATMRIAHAEFIAELEREGERATMVQITPHVIWSPVRA